ncbi:Flagellar assembly factor FliW [Phycisphaerae bacterium RAS1]|nr:Flagellar assembly factor FliW [Phycisphaerae bacterium RAS1]
MIVETTRFGTVEIDDGKVITFKEPLLGFPDQRRFVIVQTSPDPVFYWLQSAEDPALAFVVCDPRAFVPDYRVSVRKDDVEQLGLRDLEDCQVVVIVNKVGDELTANLLGPLLIGCGSMQAKQLVLADKRYGTRHPLVSLARPKLVARSA